MSVSSGRTGAELAGIIGGYAPLDSGLLVPRAYLPQIAGLLHNMNASTSPGVGDDSADGYGIGSRWLNTTLDIEFVCLDATVGAAIWVLTAGRIGARAVRTADQTGIVSSTDTKVAWNAADSYDTHGFHDPASNNTRHTVPTGLGGLFLLTATVTWDTNTTGQRQCWFWKNGGGIGGFVRNGAASVLSQTLAMVADLAAADFVEVNVWHDSGSNRQLTASVTAAMSFEITRIG